MFLGKKHETELVAYSYEIEDPSASTTPDDPNASTTSGAHCAWCGDPPDRHGSHDICALHKAQMLATSAARVERRRSRGQA